MNSEVATERLEVSRSSAEDVSTEEPAADTKGDVKGGVAVLNEAPKDGGTPSFDTRNGVRGLSKPAGLKVK